MCHCLEERESIATINCKEKEIIGCLVEREEEERWEDFKGNQGNQGIALTYLGFKSPMKFSIDEFVD